MKAAPGVETINFKERKTLDALHEMVPNGPDCSIEAVGFHYANSLLHKVGYIVYALSHCCRTNLCLHPTLRLLARQYLTLDQ